MIFPFRVSMLHRTNILREFDLRLEGRDQILERHRLEAGTWERDGVRVISRGTDVTLDLLEVPEHFVEVANALGARWQYVRLRLSETIRKVSNGSHQREQIQRLAYWEVTSFGRTFALLQSAKVEWTPAEIELALTQLAEWEARNTRFVLLPKATRLPHALPIILAPAALGALLHELVGHRLESDRHKVPFDLPTETPIPIDVWDLPGDPGQPGYTPFDDFGTIADPVRLLKGADQTQNFLSGATGNLRAADHRFHPIVRQRCLEATIRQGAENTRPSAGIVLAEFETGDALGNRVELVSNIQFLQSDGRRESLPPIKIKVVPAALVSLQVFGSSASWSPGGGCHKSLQRGLPVTHTAPWGFFPHNSNGIQLEIGRA